MAERITRAAVEAIIEGLGMEGTYCRYGVMCDDAVYAVGDMPGQSREYDDGEWTGGHHAGTTAVDVTALDRVDVTATYMGDHVYLIGGYDATGHDVDGECDLTDAVVLAVIR
jgi:hypothetical protein